jgi:hypothetical protein
MVYAFADLFVDMECAQIVVSGGKSVVSPATYSIPGIYKVRLSKPLPSVAASMACTPQGSGSDLLLGHRPCF